MKHQVNTFTQIKVLNTTSQGIPYLTGRFYEQDCPQNHIAYSIFDNRKLIIDELFAEDKATLFMMFGTIERFCIINNIKTIEIEKSLDDEVVDILLLLGFQIQESDSIKKTRLVFDVSESNPYAIR